ncbi:MAG: hypothetical protein QN122_02585 [Armatimonadota bacterium]|nr:hypothetical protein [Armatimonadota bacterium]MDR7480158.1 hypothetical protein [Armatimonadota bacterium]MDR7490327.1 hypothetical protein [Armatimonadota bacterium]MDR7503216.1 hypothetical protein [Armatimonadota bacterium]MDR7528931.1 hypothetical protein [Armatimonadota bacterium]
MATARVAPPLYRDLRPAFAGLEALVTLLRRRGFSGLVAAVGRAGEGAVWVQHGHLRGGWLLPRDNPEVLQWDDPVEVLRRLWTDEEAVVTVYPASPAAIPAVTPPRTVPARAAPGATPGTSGAPAPAAPPVRAPAAPADRAPAATPATSPPATALPWAALLGGVMVAAQRHRGARAARRLEDLANAILNPEAIVTHSAVHGTVSPARGEAALAALVRALDELAGRRFTDRLLARLGAELECAEALAAVRERAT